ncbi:MAG TPA: hypothetical protein DGX96_01545 [Lachnospiraceae bacterium]|jgi:uncharacterized protein YqgQ|nr:hypothetical protein [Lachnospiraceae bacterium]
MSYENEDIQKAQEIFSVLVEKHELSEEANPSLYRAFTQSAEVQMLVKQQGEFSRCDIERYADVIYLIPKEDNLYFGYSRQELKERLCRSNAMNRDYYLAMFVILVILVEFYDGQGTSARTRDFLRTGDLQNKISSYLKEGCDRYDRNEQARVGMAFSEMQHAWESLRSDNALSRRRTTKEGFLYNILHFLEEQGLIAYIEKDEMIKTMPKLDHFMDWNLLNRVNYERVLSVLRHTGEEESDE